MHVRDRYRLNLVWIYRCGIEALSCICRLPLDHADNGMDNFLHKRKIDGELLCYMENFIVPLHNVYGDNIVLHRTLPKTRTNPY